VVIFPKSALLIVSALALHAIASTPPAAQSANPKPTIDIVPRMGPKWTVDHIAFSHDGTRLFIGEYDLTLWDLSNGALLQTLVRPHPGEIRSMAIAAGGDRVLTGGDDKDKTAKLWDLANWRLLQTFAGHGNTVSAVAVSPDGTRVLTGSADKTAILWDVATGKPLRILSGHTGRVNAVAFAPDGARVATASEDGTMRLWDAASGATVHVFQANKRFKSVAFSPDGTRVMSGNITEVPVRENFETYNRYVPSLMLWDVTTGEWIRTLEGDEGRLNAVYVTFSPDGKHLLLAAGSVKIWDAATGETLGTIAPSRVGYRAAALSPDGTRVVTVNQSPTVVKLWNAATGELLLDIKSFAAPIESVAFSPDGARIASTGGYGTLSDQSVKLWGASTGQIQNILKRPEAASVNSVVFSPDGKHLLTGAADSMLRVWDAASGRLLRNIKTAQTYIKAIAFSQDGARVLIAGGINVELFDVATWKNVLSLPLVRGGVRAATLSHDGTRLLMDTPGQIAVMLDAATGKRVMQTFDHGEASVRSVAFSPDGTRVLTGGSRMAKLWNAATGALLWTVQFEEGSLDSSVTFTPDGAQVVLALGNATTLCDAATGKTVRQFTYRDHGASPDGSVLSQGGVKGIAVSPDGKRILAGSRDGAMRLWSKDSGELLATFIAVESGEWIAYTPEGFFDASKDGTNMVLINRSGAWIPIDRATKVLHRPDVLQEKLGGDPDGKVKAASGNIVLD
jgi:WD40 repeat protein